MDRLFFQALETGSERVAAWADLLDAINVYPVADGDTGRNLKVSLAPFGTGVGAVDRWPQMVLASATGNSGNIAAAFFSRLLVTVTSATLAVAIDAGRQAAWQAVADPKPGTMLTAFDALARNFPRATDHLTPTDVDAIVEHLDEGVRATTNRLPELKRAGVVDAGALGMFIFFEGFLCRLGGCLETMPPVSERFAGRLAVAEAINGSQFPGYCVNTTLRPSANEPLASGDFGAEDSVVAVLDGEQLRVHLHTRDHRETRNRLAAVGTIVEWQVAPMTVETAMPGASADPQAVHIMTDAAGSLTRSDARRLGVTLLDSYLVVDGRRVPESLFDAQTLYDAMADGRQVSTAQASLFQKQQSYQQVLGQHDQVLYLSVGSVYTGNHAAACRWRDANGCSDRFAVVDTGAASGRLGLVVRMVAEAAREASASTELAAMAHEIITGCDELVFLDQLKFLVAGGRLSRSKGFVGDLLGIRPVIRPTAEGAVKAGTVKRAADQVSFAVRYLNQRYASNPCLRMLLQFSDNEKRVRERIRPEIQRNFPDAQIEVGRLSLTSGAHMGPGTWAIAFWGEL